MPNKDSLNIRRTAGNASRLFDATMASKDQRYLDSFNDFPSEFSAVCLSNPYGEENSSAPNQEFKLVRICVKPISSKKVYNGSDLENIDQSAPLPGDSLPSLLQPMDAEEFKNLLEFYHTIEYLIAMSEDTSAATESLVSFGQILNCKFIKGDPNRGTAGRMIFSVPAGDPIYHEKYRKQLALVTRTSAKEPFNSSPAILLGQVPNSTSSTPRTSSGYSDPSNSDSTPEELAELRRIINIPNSKEKYRQLAIWKNNKGVPKYGGSRMTDFKNFQQESFDFELYDLVAAEESSGRYEAANNIYYPSSGGYVVNGFRTNSTPGPHPKVESMGKEVDELTIAELKDLQSLYTIERKPKTYEKVKNSIFAAGKYQIVPNTLKSILKNIPGIKDDDIFDKTTQDNMMAYLIYGGIKRKWLSDYLLGGEAHIDAALVDLAQEFSSVQCPDGLGFYGNEKARNSASKVKEVLKKVRDSNFTRPGSSSTGDIENGTNQDE